MRRTPDMMVEVGAVEPLVAATPCLQWVQAPGVGAHMVALSTPQMLKAFASRCRISRLPADLVVSGRVRPFQIGLNAAAWRRCLGQLVASGLLCGQQSFRTEPELAAAIDRLELVDATQMVITAADWQLGEELSAPARGGALPAPPPGELVFLGLVSVADLETPNSRSPWASIVRLAGALGDCLTRTARDALGSQARSLAVTLLPSVCTRFNIEHNNADAAAARALGDFLHATRLPLPLRAHSVEVASMYSELRDACAYHSSTGQQAIVEVSRLHLVGPHAPLLDRFFLRRAGDAWEASALVRDVSLLLLGKDEHPLEKRLELVEAGLHLRAATLATAANQANATAQSILAALRSAVSQAPSSAPQLAAAGAGPSSSGPAMPAQPGGADVIETALRMPAFQALGRAILGAAIDTFEGRVDILGRAMNPSLVLAVRQLMYADKALSRRDPALGRLLLLTPHLAEYFSYALVCDPATGQVPGALASYNITGPDGSDTRFLDLFCRQNLATMNWAEAAQRWLAARDGREFELVQATDAYCIPWLVEAIGEFGHRLTVAGGAPGAVTPAQGFTFASWCQLYLSHLRLVLGAIRSVEARLAMLNHAHEQFVAALHIMGDLLRRVIGAADPAKVSIGALLPADAVPVRRLRRRREAIEKALELAASFPTAPEAIMQLGGAAHDGATQLPLRSLSKPSHETHESARPDAALGKRSPSAEASKRPTASKQARMDRTNSARNKAQMAALKAAFPGYCPYHLYMHYVRGRLGCLYGAGQGCAKGSHSKPQAFERYVAHEMEQR